MFCDGCEQDRNEGLSLCAKCLIALERKVVRAFIDRVEVRLPGYNTGKGADNWLKAYRLAVMDELAEMESK